MPMQTASTGAIAASLQTMLEGMPSALVTTCATQVSASSTPQAVTPLSMSGITLGMKLLVDVANPETVTVTALDSSTFTAVFTQNHSGIWWVGTGPALYTFVKIGAVTDPTNSTSYAAITFQQRKTERYNSGWQVHSKPIFQIETGVDQTDATLAENTVMAAGDLLTALFVSRYQLNAVPGVYVTLVDTDDKTLYKAYPNGRIYRVHMTYVTAVQQYQVQLTP